ncbi:MAG: AraC family transcriptional regulator, partial [Cyanobacteria bacterium J06558_2]
TPEGFQYLHRETLSYEQEELNVRGFDEVCTYKSQWCEGRYQSIEELSSGIRFRLDEGQALLDYHTMIEHYDWNFLTAKFYLSGYHSVICPGINGVEPEYTEKKGYSYLLHLPHIEEIEQYWAGNYLQKLTLNIDLSYIANLARELDTAPKQLRNLVGNCTPQRFHFNVGHITQQMESIVQQIWYHPYQGNLAQIYLEAKVTELLVIQLSQLTESKPHTAKSTLNPKSIECVYQARAILASSLENPPSISELTKQVGLCDRTLRRGFRELFGKTVINYLTSLRMEQAERLLREGKFSISEVANSVGYSNLSYFATIFKHQFGITPRECLIGNLRKRHD